MSSGSAGGSANASAESRAGSRQRLPRAPLGMSVFDRKGFALAVGIDGTTGSLIVDGQKMFPLGLTRRRSAGGTGR
jgi:hypothetical protein